MTYVLDLKHLSLPGSGYAEFTDLDAAIEMAHGFALPANPVRILRITGMRETFPPQPIPSNDLAAVVHADGGVDHYR